MSNGPPVVQRTSVMHGRAYLASVGGCIERGQKEFAMKLFPSLKDIRAAHALTVAMADGTAPHPAYLKSLGLSETLAKRFKR